MSEISETEIKSMTKEQNYFRGYKDGKSDVLDNLRAEIEQLHYHPKIDFIKNDAVVDIALEIIDKYKAESEDEK